MKTILFVCMFVTCGVFLWLLEGIRGLLGQK